MFFKRLSFSRFCWNMDLLVIWFGTALGTSIKGEKRLQGQWLDVTHVFPV